MKLYKQLPSKIEVDGKKYKLRPYFNNVLFCLEVFKEDQYTQEEKVELCYKALIKTFRRKNIIEKSIILNEALKILFESNRKSKSEKKTFDFVQDSNYIYAGFMQAYGIDLFNYRNKLHWWKFISLFQGLPKETKIMQIIDIRTKPIPKRDKYNAEYINQLIRLKAEYKLELTQEEQEKQMQESLKGLFNSLKNMAERM